MEFVHHLRVRYHECDAQQCVFNSRYLEYLDVAMTEYFRSLGWDYRDLVAAGCDPSLVHTSLFFRSPAWFDDELDIRVQTARVGTSSFELAFETRRASDGEVILAAQTTYVNVDLASRSSRPLPHSIRQRLLSDAKENDDGDN